MNFVYTLIKFFSPHPKWIIDVDQAATYDENSNKIEGKVIFQVKRWHKFGLRYDVIADFATLVEAGNFIANYKQYPVDFEEINKL